MKKKDISLNMGNMPNNILLPIIINKIIIAKNKKKPHITLHSGITVGILESLECMGYTVKTNSIKNNLFVTKTKIKWKKNLNNHNNHVKNL